MYQADNIVLVQMERALHVTTCVSLEDYFQARGEQGKGPELTGIWWLSSWEG